jgi:hypothetical protein
LPSYALYVEGLARAELKELAYTVACDCGRVYRAEYPYFESECPYCGRRYSVTLTASREGVEIEVKPA